MVGFPKQYPLGREESLQILKEIQMDTRIFSDIMENMVIPSQLCVPYIQNFRRCRSISDVLKRLLPVYKYGHICTYSLFFSSWPFLPTHAGPYAVSPSSGGISEGFITGQCMQDTAISCLWDSSKTTTSSEQCHLELFLSHVFPVLCINAIQHVLNKYL